MEPSLFSRSDHNVFPHLNHNDLASLINHWSIKTKNYKNTKMYVIKFFYFMKRLSDSFLLNRKWLQIKTRQLYVRDTLYYYCVLVYVWVRDKVNVTKSSDWNRTSTVMSTDLCVCVCVFVSIHWSSNNWVVHCDFFQSIKKSETGFFFIYNYNLIWILTDF